MTIAEENPHDGENGTSKSRDETVSSGTHDDAPDTGTTSATSTRSTASPALKRSSTTPTLSSSTSATTSPKPSRETSPTRPHVKGGQLPPRPTTRSRKNSQDQDKSPIRAASVAGSGIPTVPSAAAIQRALSAAGTSNIPPAAQHEVGSDASRAQKTSKPVASPASKASQRASRLSSPPPAASSGSNKPISTATRKTEQSQSTPSTPSIVVDRPILAPKPTFDQALAEEDLPPPSGMRTPTRGASGSGAPLETVQESSPSADSVLNNVRPIDRKKSNTTERPARIDEDPSEEDTTHEARSRVESGNESSGSRQVETNKSGDGWKPATTASSVKAPTIHSKNSYTQLPGKLKSASEGSVKNMTVETETVSSIPQVAVGGGAGERGAPARSDTGGSVRLKPSTETIRPKKEKKKVVRKAPPVNAGNGGYLSRLFFNHRNLCSRRPSPLCSTVSSTESSTLCNDEDLADDDVSPLQSNWPVNPLPRVRSPKDTAFSANPRGPIRRYSSGLMKFSGRTASSKADVFEAKVASAVGEADSSDSEETFVYESNPPEPQSARAHRFHSRTPSTASTLSQLDHTKVRQDNHHDVVKKRSMKFATNYSTINYANDGETTVRGPSQGSRGSGTPHHHHIGRFGRGGHTSIIDKDSPFANPSKSPRSSNARFQQVTSPRHNRRQSPGNPRLSGSVRKAEEAMSYDLEGEGADDERTPLVGRSGRNRRRALPGSVRQMYLSDDHENRYCGRITAFTSLGTVLALLIAAIVITLVLCTKPLYDVQIHSIKNVLASESEIMLDLHVRATNPNIIAVQISDLDVNLFAKSRYVRTPSATPPTTSTTSSFKIREATRVPHPRSDLLRTPKGILDQLGGIDEGTDPIDEDPAADSQTMLLGRILTFDSPLIFDASPLHHKEQISVGEVRLSKPGNRTEEGGSARWERVLQHDFELIVRGVVKYTLPISSKLRSASISGKVIVHPTEEDSEGNGSFRLSPPRGQADDGSNVIITPPQAVPERVALERFMDHG
ncbi:uncharacterized protein KY384_002460 [Bacidia gigantensis]|uniref:uncharacterized protein n=1 Tax=Bacidia gigantensis TaxID=2732470 RepID=UPI001D04FE9D|nr:uncharacterized protein KY384_002460 [Bacidia gigantensis]KAG8532583.1 hypothetical protein KY384_002460 [Bacidia gigantensis]